MTYRQVTAEITIIEWQKNKESPWLSWGVCWYPAVGYSICPTAPLEFKQRFYMQWPMLMQERASWQHIQYQVFYFCCNWSYTSIMVLTTSTSQMIDRPQITTRVMIKASGVLSVIGRQQSQDSDGCKQHVYRCYTLTESTSRRPNTILSTSDEMKIIGAVHITLLKWQKRLYYKFTQNKNLWFLIFSVLSRWHKNFFGLKLQMWIRNI